MSVPAENVGYVFAKNPSRGRNGLVKSPERC